MRAGATCERSISKLRSVASNSGVQAWLRHKSVRDVAYTERGPHTVGSVGAGGPTLSGRCRPVGSLRYWRCWPVFDGLSIVLWPVVGHMIRFDHGYACCERCA